MPRPAHVQGRFTAATCGQTLRHTATAQVSFDARRCLRGPITQYLVICSGRLTFGKSPPSGNGSTLRWTSGCGMNQVDQFLFDQTNAYRARGGLNTIVCKSNANAICTEWSRELCKKYAHHVSAKQAVKDCFHV
jgi:hypothetical protein